MFVNSIHDCNFVMKIKDTMNFWILLLAVVSKTFLANVLILYLMKNQKTFSFLVFLVGIKWEHCWLLEHYD